MLQRFDHQQPSAFGEHKTLSIGVKRAAGRGRAVVASRKGFHVLERRQTHPRDRRFGAAGDHQISLAHPDASQRIAHRVGRRGTGGRDGVIGTFETVADRNVSARGVDHHFGDGEWRNAVGAFGQQPLDLLLDLVEPADARAQDDAAAKRVKRLEIQSSLLNRLGGGVNGKLRETIEPLDLASFNDPFEAEIRDVPPKMDLVMGGVQNRKIMDAAVPIDEPLPKCVQFAGQRSDNAHPGDDNAAGG